MRPRRTASPTALPDSTRFVLDKLRQGLCVFDGAQRLTLFNRRYAELYDLDPGDLRIGMSLRDVVDLRFAAGTGPSMRREAYAVWREQIAVDNRVAQSVVRLRNGRSIEIYHEPTPDGGWVATHDDITERLEAEAVLRAKTTLLNVTLDAMDQGLMMVDASGVVRICNGRAITLLDLPPEMMQAEPTFEAVRRYQIERGEFDKASETMRRWVAEAGMERRSHTYERERPDGTILEIRTVPLPDGSAVRTYTDITERKTNELRVAESEARLRALTDALPQMVWVARQGDGTSLYTNRRFRDYLGNIGPTRQDRLANHHPDDGKRAALAWPLAEAEGRTFEIEERWRRHDGVYHWHKTVLIPVRHDGVVVEWIGTALDVDDILSAREALRASEERLAFALDAGSDGLWDCNLVTDEIWLSDRWWSMLGYAPGDLESHARTWWRLLHPNERPTALHLLAEHLRGESATFECEHRLRRKDDTWSWVLTRGKVVAHDEHGRPRRIVGTQIDINARKTAQSQIAHMARHDGLTDLPNRTLFRERLDQRLAELGRYGGASAVLCIDLDRFKAVNDTLGHAAGDAVLREVAHRLRATLRSEDLVARLGGDEFAVLLGGMCSADQAAIFAERLTAAMKGPIEIGEQQADVSLSIGIALVPDHGRDAETVFKRADLALYRAKTDGRDTYRFYELAMDEAAAERRQLEVDLRRAISKDELTLHYQPQLCTATSELVGFEALVRWKHPSRGLISPSAFIPLAEEAGLISALGEWVLRTACREAARWHRPLKVAVNLSPKQFQQADLTELVLGILTETGLSPKRLEFEVTETVIINDVDQALGILRRMKSLGIRIAIDDFGTGYSSLSVLKAFPFDKIKIDRSFVGTMGESPQSTVIVRSVLALGRSLGMGVVAEGVETLEQLNFLKQEACDEVQGFLLGRPQPIEHFAHAVYPAERPVRAEVEVAGRHRFAAPVPRSA